MILSVTTCPKTWIDLLIAKQKLMMHSRGLGILFAAGVAGKATAAQTAPPLDITIGIILVEFADVKGSSYTESDFEDMFLWAKL